MSSRGALADTAHYDRRGLQAGTGREGGKGGAHRLCGRLGGSQLRHRKRVVTGEAEYRERPCTLRRAQWFSRKIRPHRVSPAKSRTQV